MALIETDHLSKHFKVLKRQEGLRGAVKDLFSRDYRVVKAVNNLSLRIEKGEIVGFIGPNGAGKSTTIKMLIGVLEPTEGTIRVDGFNPYKHRQKYMQQVGVVFGQRTQLWWEISVIESFKMLKAIYEIDDHTYRENMEMYNELLNLKSLYAIPVRHLSLGQRVLCDIAVAFLHNPKVIFLDEPTIGLDVSIKHKVRKIIKHLNERKQTTIVLTSHDTGDIEELAQRIILIDKGTSIYDGDIQQFNQLFGAYRTLKINLPDCTEQVVSAISEKIKLNFGVHEGMVIEQKESGWLNITINQDQIQLTALLNLLMQEYHVKDIKIEEIELQNVIQRVYDGDLA